MHTDSVPVHIIASSVTCPSRPHQRLLHLQVEIARDEKALELQEICMSERVRGKFEVSQGGPGLVE